MTPGDFKSDTKILIIQGFRTKLQQLSEDYDRVNADFKKLCDMLDENLNESMIHEITSNMTIHLSKLDIIKKKIDEISSIIQKIMLELSN